MDQRAQHIQALLAALQHQWGERRIWRGSQIPRDTLSVLPTDIADLDAALHIGGIPRGKLTELLGRPTSGMTTLALLIVAHTQARAELTASIDLPGSFDAEYAARCGVQLDQLVLVRPETATEALELVHALIACRGFGLIVVDQLGLMQAVPHHAQLLDRALRALPSLLADAPTALLVLTALPYTPVMVDAIAYHGSVVAGAASVRLHVVRTAWHDDPLRIGCTATATVFKHRLAAAGAQAGLYISFDREER